VLVLTIVNVRDNNKILIVTIHLSIIIIIFEGATGYTGDYCQQGIFNSMIIHLVIIYIFTAICLPAVAGDSLSYQAPAGICENGGTCISPNLCQVSVSKRRCLCEYCNVMLISVLRNGMVLIVRFRYVILVVSIVVIVLIQMYAHVILRYGMV
jgi:hypothetical protein